MTNDRRTFHVPGISCDHCKGAIEGRVGLLDGVQDVAVDVAGRTVTVSGGDPDAIEAAIVAAGYRIE